MKGGIIKDQRAKKKLLKKRPRSWTEHQFRSKKIARGHKTKKPRIDQKKYKNLKMEEPWKNKGI